MPLQSLSEIYDDHVSKTTDVVAAKARLEAELNRLGLPATDPTVSQYVGVCFEEWNEIYHWPVFEDMPSHFYHADNHLTGAWDALIDATREAVIRLIRSFRLGVLRAVVSDQQQGNAGIKSVPASWWLKFDGFVSFDENRLAEGLASEPRDFATDVKVEQILLEKRVDPDSALLQAVEQMAGPEILDDLLRARNNLSWSISTGMQSLEQMRKGTRFSQYDRLDDALRTHLNGCLTRGSLRLRCFSSPTADPEWLPADRLPLVELEYEKSTVNMPGHSPIPVRVFPGETEAKKGPGRRSRKSEILTAYERLVAIDAIDFEAKQIRAIMQVRKEVKRRANDPSEKALGDEAIRKVISDLFQAKKAVLRGSP